MGFIVGESLFRSRIFNLSQLLSLGTGMQCHCSFESFSLSGLKSTKIITLDLEKVTAKITCYALENQVIDGFSYWLTKIA